jgi:DNA polymerase-1
MRVIAKLSNEPKLVKIYKDGISLHKVVAERFYGADYDKEQYVNAKNMDFGVAYGQSGQTFKEKHDIPVAEGERFVKWWYNEFPAVRDLQRSIHEEAFKNGFAVSPTGRKRRFYLITDQNKNEVKREAFNFVPQNTASELTLWSCIRLMDEFNPSWGKIILSVHDSIVADVRDNYISEAATVIKQVMESSAKDLLDWNFPFESETAIGPNWGELKEITV